jgi:hypothetical protein
VYEKFLKLRNTYQSLALGDMTKEDTQCTETVDHVENFNLKKGWYAKPHYLIELLTEKIISKAESQEQGPTPISKKELPKQIENAAKIIQAQTKIISKATVGKEQTVADALNIVTEQINTAGIEVLGAFKTGTKVRLLDCLKTLYKRPQTLVKSEPVQEALQSLFNVMQEQTFETKYNKKELTSIATMYAKYFEFLYQYLPAEKSKNAPRPAVTKSANKEMVESTADEDVVIPPTKQLPTPTKKTTAPNNDITLKSKSLNCSFCFIF